MKEFVEIPIFDDEFLVRLAVCGRIRTRSATIISALKNLESHRSIYRVNGSDNLYVEIFGGGLVKNHLHVNVLLQPSGWMPKKRAFAKAAELQDQLSPFIGQKADIDISGDFMVPVDELPKNGLVRSAMNVNKHAGYSVRQTSQTLSINDGILDQLSWTLMRHGKYVRIQLSVKDSVVIDEEYLVNSEVLVQSAFQVLIFSEKKNGATHR